MSRRNINNKSRAEELAIDVDEESDTDSISSDEEMPIFMNRILHDDYLSEETRNEFYELFAKRYLSDRDYQNRVKGKYILFLNDKYNGIYDTKEEIERIGKQGDDRYIYKIGDGYIRKNFFDLKIRSFNL
jgi:hypothetical protein